VPTEDQRLQQTHDRTQAEAGGGADEDDGGGGRRELQLGLEHGNYDEKGHSLWFGHGKVNAFSAVQEALRRRDSVPAQVYHQASNPGLAIPDFPLAYGTLWPATDPESVASYNAQRLEVLAVNPITAGQIALQMFHRLMAIAILGAVAFSAWSARRALGPKNLISHLSLVWLGLIVAQVVLGAATIWSDKAADIATAHVMIGALCLATGALLTLVATRGRLLGRWVTTSAAAVENRLPSRLEPQSSAVARLA